MISCFTSLIPKLIPVEIAGDDCGFAGEPLGWGSSYRAREDRKGFYTEGAEGAESTEATETRGKSRFLAALGMTGCEMARLEEGDDEGVDAEGGAEGKVVEREEGCE
jgi:hypothetical protein